jgi:DNA-directed RNA polymerase specialized sigma24 family protein
MEASTTRDPMLVQPDLASLLASLPEEEQIVLALHYVKGRATGDIAELLGVPERAVLAVLASGRQRLTKAIGIPPSTPPSA